MKNVLAYLPTLCFFLYSCAEYEEVMDVDAIKDSISVSNENREIAIEQNSRSAMNDSTRVYANMEYTGTVDYSPSLSNDETLKSIKSNSDSISNQESYQVINNIEPFANEPEIDAIKPKKIVVNAMNNQFINNVENATTLSSGFIIKILNDNVLDTNEKHTLLVEIENTNNTVETIDIAAKLPKDWTLISISSLKPFKPNQKRNAIISFFIPANSPSGNVTGKLYVKNKKYNELQYFDIPFKVANNYDLEMLNVNIPQNVQAGETIEATYLIKNNGNTVQEISLKTSNTLLGNSEYIIAPDSTVIVKIGQKTSNKIFTLRNSSVNLEAFSATSGKTISAFNSFKIFPVKIKQEDNYFRFPIKAGVFYNSFTSKNEHFSTVSAEVTGNGYLDVNREHNLNFILRGPRQENLRRFAVTDQYSLIYSYKDKTTLYLGDHSYFINRLGFNGKYGMGFRLDQNIKNWTLSTFYNKPRLYDFDAEALYGVKASYFANENLSAGVSLVKSKRVDNFTNKIVSDNSIEKGQIMTLNLDYLKRNTQFKAEVSGSVTNKHSDYANYFNLVQKIDNLTYSGNFTVAGKNYFGTLNNSVQFSNSLNLNVNKWNFTLGQGLYKVNKTLNPLFYAAEPYFENYFALLGYRFNNKHSINFRLDKRIREDQLEPKNYHYKEYGLNYGYKYRNDRFMVNFNGRIGQTQNLLTSSEFYRDTYSHNLNLSYRFFKNLKIQGSFNHNYSNRYGNSNSNLNYLRYNAGFNYRLNKSLRFSANYNSGFSPEDTYLKRDYINANLTATINRSHQFQLQANYFENPGTINNKELFTYAKYTYAFGAPLKKVLQQGGLIGKVVSNDDTVNVKGIKIIGTGKTVMTDADGNFELNNLPLGKNYILVEESTLQKGVITSARIPYEVQVAEHKKASLEIQLVKAASVSGQFEYAETYDESFNLEGYIKLHNSDFTYYSESNKQGQFSFDQIVPGNYTLSLIRFKENNKVLVMDSAIGVNLNAGEKLRAVIKLKTMARRIKFKSKNYKVGK
ncbi:SpaA isopeptide-forming pilin-related protein [Maribacter sp. LLG6340-A2]|uniref:SpaA isopeptide-forming pilin-related protein n=1 Tax=Maribacter sp. LLG6340-A2 TaxID=3160834 RepID=UPI00387090E3